MKNAEAKKPAKRPRGWAIDPIKSFLDGEEGEKNKTLIMMEPNEKPIKDPVLWNTGKKAFDILLENSEGETTQVDLDEFVTTAPGLLIKGWNQWVGFVDDVYRPGGTQLSNKKTGRIIIQFYRITTEPDSFEVPFKIEPRFSILDDFYEMLSLSGDKDMFPFNRKLLAAYFTILHVDIAANHISAGCISSPSTLYSWVTLWVDKLDRYNRTKQVIKSRQAYLKSEKSRKMNAQRHSPRNEAMQLVTDDWSQRKSDFRSAERAGNYYAGWLVDKGFVEYQPRTITTWIRNYAKDNGIKLR